jgi:hypothetical protein
MLTATFTSHQEAARYLYNEFYMGQVRLAVMRNVHTLGISDLLKNKPLDIKELAMLTNTHEQSLHRIMITAFQMGLFSMQGNVFGLTIISELLVSDSPMSMSGLMSFMCEDYMTQSLNTLDQTIATGSPSFLSVTGQNFYDYLNDHDEQRRNFNAAMVCMDKTVSPLLATKYDWTGVKTLADLGGGVGASSLHVLKENTSVISATVLEVQDVVDKANALAPTHIEHFGSGTFSKLKYSVGDIFKPKTYPEADVYMLKNIIHDWNDSECDTLLSNVRNHLKGDTNKRLLVVEKIVQPDALQPHKAGHDIVKLAFFHEHAKHRNIDSFRDMFSRNGFSVTQVAPLADTDYYVIEGRLTTATEVYSLVHDSQLENM